MTRIAGSYDIETLGTEPGSIILSAGLLTFDMHALNTFEELVNQGTEIILDIDSQREAGCVENKSTLKWWEQQGEAAQRVLYAAFRTPVREFYTVMQDRLNLTPFDTQRLEWFARGPTFDMVLTEVMFKKFNLTPFWKFWLVRDSRTWFDAKGLTLEQVKVIPEFAGMIPHNALHDAAWDAWILQRTHTPELIEEHLLCHLPC